MPFQSEAQRKFMFAKHPDIAKKWAHGQHSTTGGAHKMPSRQAALERFVNAKSAKAKATGKPKGK